MENPENHWWTQEVADRNLAECQERGHDVDVSDRKGAWCFYCRHCGSGMGILDLPDELPEPPDESENGPLWKELLEALRRPLTGFWAEPLRYLEGRVLKDGYRQRRGEIFRFPLVRCSSCGRQHLPQSGRWCGCGASLPFEQCR